MSSQESINELNEFLSQINKLKDPSELGLQSFQKKDLQSLFFHFFKMVKGLAQNLNDLKQQNSQLSKFEKQNNMLRSQIQHLNLVINQLNDIKVLYTQAQQKLSKSVLQISYSKQKINQLEAFSLQLTKQKSQKFQNYQQIMENNSNLIQQVTLQKQNIKNQLEQKSRQVKQLKLQLQQIKTSNRKLNIQLQEVTRIRQRFQQQIQTLKSENKQMRNSYQGLELTFVTKLENISAKSYSVRQEDPDPILQQSVEDLEDDHQVMRNMEDNPPNNINFYDNLNISSQNGNQSSFTSKPSSSAKIAKKSFISVEKDNIQQNNTKYKRRKTIQFSNEKIQVLNQQVDLKIPRNIQSNSSSQFKIQKKPILKIDPKKNKINSLVGQRRSSGNSPLSSSSIRLQKVSKQQSSFKRKQVQVQKSVQENNIYNQLLKVQNEQIKNQLVEIKKQLRIKLDLISQLQGQNQIMYDRQSNLNKQMSECQQKISLFQKNQFQMKRQLDFLKSRKSKQKMEYLELKQRLQAQILQLEQLCQNYSEQIKNEKEENKNLKFLCNKTNEEIKSYKTKIKQIEQTIKTGLFSRIQNCFQRIFHQQKQEVKTYESPDRIVNSKQSSLQNSIRRKALSSEHLMMDSNQAAEHDYILERNSSQNQIQRSQLLLSNERLRFGIQQIEKNRQQELNSESDKKISPKQQSDKNEDFIQNYTNSQNKQKQLEFPRGDQGWPQLLDLENVRYHKRSETIEDNDLSLIRDIQASENRNYRKRQRLLRFDNNVYCINGYFNKLKLDQSYQRILQNSEENINIQIQRIQNKSVQTNRIQLKDQLVIKKWRVVDQDIMKQNQEVQTQEIQFKQSSTQTQKKQLKQSSTQMERRQFAQSSTQMETKQSSTQMERRQFAQSSTQMQPKQFTYSFTQTAQMQHNSTQTQQKFYNQSINQLKQSYFSQLYFKPSQFHKSPSLFPSDQIHSSQPHVQRYISSYSSQDVCAYQANQHTFSHTSKFISQSNENSHSPEQQQMFSSQNNKQCCNTHHGNLNIPLNWYQSQNPFYKQTAPLQLQHHYLRNQEDYQIQQDQINCSIPSQQQYYVDDSSDEQQQKQRQLTLNVNLQIIKSLDTCCNSIPLSPSNEKYLNITQSNGASTQISPQQSRIEYVDKFAKVVNDNKMIYQQDDILNKITEQQEDKKDSNKKSECSSSRQAAFINQFNEQDQMIEKVNNFIKLMCGNKLKFKQEHNKMDFQIFKNNHKWDLSRVYILQVQRQNSLSCQGTLPNTQQLVLWRNGLIQICPKQYKYIIAKNVNRVIQTKNLVTLGNCQIILGRNTIETKRNSRHYFTGNLWQSKWDIKNITIYS